MKSYQLSVIDEYKLTHDNDSTKLPHLDGQRLKLLTYMSREQTMTGGERAGETLEVFNATAVDIDTGETVSFGTNSNTFIREMLDIDNLVKQLTTDTQLFPVIKISTGKGKRGTYVICTLDSIEGYEDARDSNSSQ